MSLNLSQMGDGSVILRNTNDGIADLHVGGPAVGTGAAPRIIAERCMKMALAAADAAAGVLTWQNTASYDVIVNECMIDITHASTGACTLSAGVAATAVSAANLIDTLSVAAAGIFDNVTDKGTLGKSRQRIPAGQYFTISVASGASAGLVGNCYLTVIPATA